MFINYPSHSVYPSYPTHWVVPYPFPWGGIIPSVCPCCGRCPTCGQRANPPQPATTISVTDDTVYTIGGSGVTAVDCFKIISYTYGDPPMTVEGQLPGE